MNFSSFNIRQSRPKFNSMLVVNQKSRSRIRRKTLSQKVEVGINTLVFATLTIACMVSLIYLAHSNKVSTKGYQLKSLREDRSMLVTENEVWNMKIARSQVLERIKNDPVIAQMQDVTKPMFIRTDTAVAQK